MREVELKGILPDPEAAVAALEAAGATLLFRGRLEDRRYDTPERSLALRDLIRMRLGWHVEIPNHGDVVHTSSFIRDRKWVPAHA